MSNLDMEREELASIAASLRAYLEWQHDCGSAGIPRRPKARTGGEARGAEMAKAVATDAASVPSPQKAEATPPAPPRPPPAPPRPPAPESALPPILVSGGPPEESRPQAAVARASSPPAAASAPNGAPRPLPVLREAVKACVQCGLHATRTNTVFERGNIEAKLCFIGEAPGADEDAQGLPFVGRAGQLLDRMIRAMGLDPEKDVYICNIIKCRPPGNRRPEPDETDKCIPFLHEQVAHMKPKVIVALGNTAVASLLGTKLGITKVRGSWKLYRGAIPVMPTYHPSYLLRPGPAQAEAKRQAWEDLQTVMKELGLPAPGPRSSS